MAKEKSATKICKHCSTEIPFEAKVCPNCRRKVKGGKLKWILLALVVLGIIGAASSGGDDKNSQDNAPAQTQEASADTTANTEAQPAATTEKTTEAKIEYHTYDCTELFDDLKANAMKAEKEHQDEYVVVTGYLGTIDSDGQYIGLGAGEDNYDYMFDEIHCNIKSQAQTDAILEKSKGDAITVKGKITQIGELIGYHLDIIGLK